MMFGVGFRAAGIQSYILSGGALKDIAAGSEMIERLCTRDLAAGLAACGLPEKCIHFAAAGGFHLVGLEETEARRFARVWSLMVAERAPGLLHAVVVAQHDNPAGLIGQLQRRLDEQVRLPWPALPAASPISLRSARTGLAAVEETAFEGEPPEAVDLATQRRRQQITSGAGALEQAFALPEGHTFSRDSNAIALSGRNTAVAMVHIDGMGFGQLFRRFDAALQGHPQHVPWRKCLSEAVAAVVRTAARRAIAFFSAMWEARRLSNDGSPRTKSACITPPRTRTTSPKCSSSSRSLSLNSEPS